MIPESPLVRQAVRQFVEALLARFTRRLVFSVTMKGIVLAVSFSADEGTSVTVTFPPEPVVDEAPSVNGYHADQEPLFEPEPAGTD